MNRLAWIGLVSSFVIAACVVKPAPPPSGGGVEVRDHRDGQGPGGGTPGGGGVETPPGGGGPEDNATGAGGVKQPPKVAEGGACTVGADCDSGTCEGLGCGPGLGKCAAKNRACTRDLVSYCGCDGQTFQGSGSCPGRTYAAKGACPAPAPPAKAADGGSCTTGGDCASGLCEGQGCGPGMGKCMPKGRACTKDLREYCGCDGQTFRSSGSCPGNTYASKGACPKPATIEPALKKAPDGGACGAAGDCQSGICEGLGCDGKSLGKCMPKDRMCTADIRPYCGCDGQTFQGSGSCPGKRYSAKAACPAPSKAGDKKAN